MKVSPPPGAQRSSDLFVVYKLHIVGYQLMSPVGLKDVPKIEHYPAIRFIFVGVFVETHPVGGSQRHVDSEIIQCNFIQARRGLFRFFLKSSHRFDGISTRKRKKSHVSKVSDPCSTKVGMTKRVNLPVVVMVSAAGVPSQDMGVRT